MRCGNFDLCWMEPIVLCSPHVNYDILISNGFVVFTTTDDGDDSNFEVRLSYLAASLLYQNQLPEHLYILCPFPCPTVLKLLRKDGVIGHRVNNVYELLARKRRSENKLDKKKLLMHDIDIIYK